MQEQQSQQAIQARQQQRTVDHASMSEAFIALFDEWKTGCNVCRVKGRSVGRSVGRKGWRICGCTSVEEHGEIAKACDWLKTIRWEAAWTACQWCWAPQAICHSWEAVHDHGPTRYRKKGQRQCQYRGCLMEAVAIIMNRHGDGVMTWIFDEIERTGREVEVHEWLGATIKEGGLEMSGMAWLFYRWAGRSKVGSVEVSSGETDRWVY